MEPSADVQALLERARSREDRGDLPGALSDYEAVLKCNPPDDLVPEVYCARGLIRETMGDLGGAGTDYEAAIQCKPGLALGFVRRGNLRLLLADFPGAIADCNKAIGIDANQVEAYLVRALAHQAQGRHADASADCLRANDISPGHPDVALIRQGIEAAQAGMAQSQSASPTALGFGEPVMDATQPNRSLVPPTDTAITRPASPRELLSQAETKLAGGDLIGAVQDCTQAIRLEPNCVEAFVTRALARHAQGYSDRAQVDFDKAISIQPASPLPYLVRARLYAAEENLQQACHEYDQALLIAADDAEALVGRAQIRAAQSDTAGAIADCDRVLQADAQNVQALLTRSAARWELEQFDRALTDCELAIKLEPDNDKLFLLRGNIRQSLGDREGADRDFQKAAQLDPDTVDSELVASSQEPGFPPDRQIIPFPGTEAGVLGADVEEREYQGLPTVPVATGPRPWIVAGIIYGALAGFLFGIMNETFAACLALLVFVPIFTGVFASKFLGFQRAGGVGLALSLVAIGLLLFGPDADRPLLQVKTENFLNLLWWLLAFGVVGSFLFLFSGTSQLGSLLGSILGGVSQAGQWAKGGAQAGLVLGAILAVVANLLSDQLAGTFAGALAGLIVGGAAGNKRMMVVSAILGGSLGVIVADNDLPGLFRVLGAGVGGGLYWTIAGGLVGLLTGGAVGARRAEQVASGPLFSRLLGVASLVAQQNKQMAVGLLMGGAGLFVGAGVGLAAGCVLGGLAVVDQVLLDALPLESDDLVTWLSGGALLGVYFCLLFRSRGNEKKTSGKASRSLFFLLGIGVVAGLVLGALIFRLGIHLGDVVYWVLAGATIGSVTAAKLWTMAEK